LVFLDGEEYAVGGKIYRRLLVKHPLFVAAMVVSFGLMHFSLTADDYLAYSIYEAEHVLVPRKVFGNKRELHRKYEEIYGRDVYQRTPELCGVFSVLLMFVSGLAMVFSQR
jgi:hypothetical protein